MNSVFRMDGGKEKKDAKQNKPVSYLRILQDSLAIGCIYLPDPTNWPMIA